MSCSTVQNNGMSAKKRAISDNLQQLIKRSVYHLAYKNVLDVSMF